MNEDRSLSLKLVTIVIGPLAASSVSWILWNAGYELQIVVTVFVAVWCAAWWILEPVPLQVTSLIPIVVLPASGVITTLELAQAVGHPIVLLLMGTFMLSMAMEKSGAHKRIAFLIVKRVGSHRRLMILGFMLTAASLSMWMSSVATTLMLLPIAVVAIGSKKGSADLTLLVLGIAYAANIGGIATPIGSAPNLIFLNALEIETGRSIGFLTWMSWTLPILVIMLPLIAIWLTRHQQKKIDISLPQIGTWQKKELVTLSIFGLTILAWIFRTEPNGGWSSLIGLNLINDASIALTAVFLCFLIPDGDGSQVLDWKTASNIPWAVLIIVASGLTIATAFSNVGLDQVIGKAFDFLTLLPIPLIVLLVCLFVTFLTEIISNTAATALLMPILAAMAQTTDIPAIMLMAPAAISASFAFMLPVATGPNAVIYGLGYVSTSRMTKEGFALNLLGAIVISACTIFSFSEFLP